MPIDASISRRIPSSTNGSRRSASSCWATAAASSGCLTLAWAWRRAYTLGLLVMSVELFACAFLHSYALVLLALALGGFGNGLALVHDRILLSHSTPECMHGRVFGLQKTCVSFAFALSFLASGALIASVGVQAAFFACAVGLTLVQLFVFPRLRRAWPAPNTDFGRASLGAHGEIAQLVEHTTENRGVPGSSPGLAISVRRTQTGDHRSAEPRYWFESGSRRRSALVRRHHRHGAPSCLCQHVPRSFCFR